MSDWFSFITDFAKTERAAYLANKAAKNEAELKRLEVSQSSPLERVAADWKIPAMIGAGVLLVAYVALK